MHDYTLQWGVVGLGNHKLLHKPYFYSCIGLLDSLLKGQFTQIRLYKTHLSLTSTRQIVWYYQHTTQSNRGEWVFVCSVFRCLSRNSVLFHSQKPLFIGTIYLVESSSNELLPPHVLNVFSQDGCRIYSKPKVSARLWQDEPTLKLVKVLGNQQAPNMHSLLSASQCVLLQKILINKLLLNIWLAYYNKMLATRETVT